MRLSAQTSIIKLNRNILDVFPLLGFLSILLFTLPASSTGYYNVFFGIKNISKLAFTSSAQTLEASLCSGGVTVQSQDSNGNAKNVISNLTVNLTGPVGVIFYSDSDCVVAVSSVTILTGTSAASFYFTASGTGSTKLIAAAIAYVPAQQIETLTTNAFVWTGGGGNSIWATSANWSGGTAPSSSDIAVFDGTCSSNCSPTVAVDPNVKGVRVNSGYNGIITQTPSITLTIGTKGWVHFQGFFAGGNSAIQSSGIIAIVGGTWTNTSGTLSVIGGSCSTKILFNMVGGTFLHNNGMTKFTGGSNGYCYGNYTIAGTSAINFYHLEFDNYFSSLGDGSIYTANQTLNVAGNLTIGAVAGKTKVLSGTINLTGDLVSLSGSNGGDATINIIGNGAQKYFGSTGVLPSIIVNTTGSLDPDVGTTVLNASGVTIQQGTFTAPTGTLKLVGELCATTTLFNESGGTFLHNNGMIKFTGGSNGYCHGNYTIAGTSAINFYHLEFDNYFSSLGDGSIYTANQTLNVAGNLTIGAVTGVVQLNSISSDLSGNLSVLTGANGGTASFNFVGNSTQTVTQVSGTIMCTGNVSLNQTGAGNVSLSSHLTSASTNWTVVAGSINMNNYNLSLQGLALGGTILTKSGGTLIVAGIPAGTGAIYGGTVNP